jgi:DNA mismatch endonuclease (patch repair protein)
MPKMPQLTNVSKEDSKRLRAVKSKGNKTTEIKFRLGLVRKGIKNWKMHCPNVLGKPDFYFPNENLAIFIDGCFWHGCKKCGQMPTNNREYWLQKFKRNKKRDKEVRSKLEGAGMLVIRFWEHDIKVILPRCLTKVERTLNKLRKIQ